MFDPAYLLERFGGISHGSRIQQYGCSRSEVRRAADAGRIDRVRQGVYALPDLDPDIVTAAAHGGALTCASALRAWGVWVLPEPDRSIHVWLGKAGRAHAHPGCACSVHFSVGRSALGLAPVADCLIHAYRCIDGEAFFAAYESAWNKRLIGAHDRARIRAALPRSAEWMLDLARPDAESGLESLLRLRLHLLGIRLDCQVDIAGVGRVDFVVGRRLILEVDGRENHAGVDRRHRDLMRDAAASARGFETLRFDYAMVVHDWPSVVAAIEQALLRTAH